MKKRILFFTFFILLIFYTSSCKEEDANLAISITSLGYNNTHIGYLGGTLGVNAGILAEKKIENIDVEIRKENGNLKYGDENDAFIFVWSFDSVFTDKYSGETEATFIEDIVIPMDADTGAYIFTIKVTDQKGNKTSAQDDFKLNYGK
jgi:hypothetical protein